MSRKKACLDKQTAQCCIKTGLEMGVVKGGSEQKCAKSEKGGEIVAFLLLDCVEDSPPNKLNR